MKRFSFAYIIIAVASLQIAAAQQEKNSYDSVANLVKTAINKGESTTIYKMTSSAFQKRMTEAQFKVGMNKFKAKTGAWKNLAYSTTNEKGVDYLAEFELSQQLFSLKLDDNKKIERINFEDVPIKIKPKSYQVASNNTLANATDKLIDSLVQPYIQKGNTAGLVIAIIKDGKVKRYSYGSTNKSTQQLPDPELTIFEIGSVTKTFTALLLAQQVVAKETKLEASINTYLPDSVPSLAFNGQQIKLVHLANHTAGFPRLPENIFNGNVDPKNPYLHYVADSLYSYLVHYKNKIAPGTRFSYSNYGAGLLGTILEKQTQLDFGTLINEKIAKPLGMKHTFVAIPSNLKANFATGYNENGFPTSPWDLASLKGSGAIRSTLNDMVVYTQAQMDKHSPLYASMSLSHQTTFNGPGQMMGLGWRINKNNDQTYYHHAGGTGGFRSFVGFDIKTRKGVVILSNAAEEVADIGMYLLTHL